MKLIVELRRDELGRLERLALKERRRPAEQAAVLIVHSLERAESAHEPAPRLEGCHGR